MFKNIGPAATLVAAVSFVAANASGSSVAIISGYGTSTESSTTAFITGNLVNLENLAGNTTTIFDTPPSSLAGYSAVWDVRFFDSAALTSGVDSQYTSYLAGGGDLFLIGENSFASARDSSITSLVTSLGGGHLNFFDSCNLGGDAQTVNAPYTGPNPVSNINYQCSGAFFGSGTGQFITQYTPLVGSGILFAPGTLSAAPAGSLITFLDANFLEGTIDTNSQNLVMNLIGYKNNPGPPEPGSPGNTPTGPGVTPIYPDATPEPASFALLGGGLLVLGILRRKRLVR